MTETKPGRTVWHDLMTTDLDGALRFYGALVGWQTRRMDYGAAGAYAYISVGGRDIGGVVPYEAGSGLSTHWYSYVRVEDVDATTARATANSGKIRVPGRDIKDTGRFALYLDPKGAEIASMSLLPPKEPPAETGAEPAVVATAAIGDFAWEELWTPDAEASRDFYASAFGWHLDAPSAPLASDAGHVMRRDDQSVAAHVSAQPREGAGAEWVSFLVVDDVDERTAHAATLGARVERKPLSLEGIGRVAVLVDPQGARFGLIQP